MKNGIPPLFFGFTARFNTVVQKQIVTKRGTVTATFQHGGQYLTGFRLGGRNHSSQVICD